VVQGGGGGRQHEAVGGEAHGAGHEDDVGEGLLHPQLAQLLVVAAGEDVDLRHQRLGRKERSLQSQNNQQPPLRAF